MWLVCVKKVFLNHLLKSHKPLDFLKKYVGNSELSAILVKNVLLLGLIKPLSILLDYYKTDGVTKGEIVIVVAGKES